MTYIEWLEQEESGDAQREADVELARLISELWGCEVCAA